MKVVLDPGMLTIRTNVIGLQFYCPIVVLSARAIKLSFSTVLIASLKTWQFKWSVGFQVLGFGFGIGQYK